MSLIYWIAALSGALIGGIRLYIANKPWLTFRSAIAKFKKSSAAQYPVADIFGFGGHYMDSLPPSVWFITKTDEDRHRLSQDESLIIAFKEVLQRTSYPSGEVSSLLFVCESQETVNRDFRGSWSLCKFSWRKQQSNG
jgi:hypothetical protein